MNRVQFSRLTDVFCPNESEGKLTMKYYGYRDALNDLSVSAINYAIDKALKEAKDWLPKPAQLREWAMEFLRARRVERAADPDVCQCGCGGTWGLRPLFVPNTQTVRRAKAEFPNDYPLCRAVMVCRNDPLAVELDAIGKQAEALHAENGGTMPSFDPSEVMAAFCTDAPQFAPRSAP